MKKLLALLTSAFIVTGMTSVAYADDGADNTRLTAQSALATQEAMHSYTLGETYETTEADGYDVFQFTITERSHVYALVETSYDDERLAFYDNLGNSVSAGSETRKSMNSLRTLYTYKHGKNLNAGTYKLRVDSGFEGDLKVLITAEPVISLGRTAINSLTSPASGKVTAKVSPVTDALAYQYQFSKKASFSGAKTISSPATACTATGLAKGAYYYVRVRPYAVYNDGLAVYGNWSRAQAVYVKKLSNSVTISTGSKTLQRSTLKERDVKFQIVADDQRNAKLTFKLASAPAKAKSFLSLNKSTGVMTVKKGLKPGAYKLKVKVTAAATSSYKAASKTKQITLKVK